MGLVSVACGRNILAYIYIRTPAPHTINQHFSQNVHACMVTSLIHSIAMSVTLLFSRDGMWLQRTYGMTFRGHHFSPFATHVVSLFFRLGVRGNYVMCCDVAPTYGKTPSEPCMHSNLSTKIHDDERGARGIEALPRSKTHSAVAKQAEPRARANTHADAIYIMQRMRATADGVIH